MSLTSDPALKTKVTTLLLVKPAPSFIAILNPSCGVVGSG